MEGLTKVAGLLLVTSLVLFQVTESLRMNPKLQFHPMQGKRMETDDVITFSDLDKDRDGVVSISDLKKVIEYLVDADLDGDGEVTVKEWSGVDSW